MNFLRLSAQPLPASAAGASLRDPRRRRHTDQKQSRDCRGGRHRNTRGENHQNADGAKRGKAAYDQAAEHPQLSEGNFLGRVIHALDRTRATRKKCVKST